MKVHLKANLKDGSNYEVDVQTDSPDECAQVAQAITKLVMGEMLGSLKNIVHTTPPAPPTDCWSDPDLLKDRIDNLEKMKGP